MLAIAGCQTGQYFIKGNKMEIKFTNTALLVVFLVLKLVGVINWSWLWVLAPVWIPLAGLVLVAIFMLISAIFVSIKDRKIKKRG
jgi:ABC-type polysaccharide/polyol phosphate export permease